MKISNPDGAKRDISYWGFLLLLGCLLILGSAQVDRSIAGSQGLKAKGLETSPAPKWNGAPFCQVSDDLDEILEDLQKQLKKFSEDLRKIPESREFKRLEKEWKRLLDKIKRAEKLGRDKIQKEILDRLREELEKLKEKLQKLKKKKAVKPIEV